MTFDEGTTDRLYEILVEYRRVRRVALRPPSKAQTRELVRTQAVARTGELVEELRQLTNATHPMTAIRRAYEATEHLWPLESGKMPGAPRDAMSKPIVGSRIRSYE